MDYEKSSWLVAGVEDIAIPKEPAWSNLRVAVYMTTHWSSEHVQFLQKCWPAATTRLPLLRDAHLILHTSQLPDPDVMESLNFESIEVKLQPQKEIPAGATEEEIEAQKQAGAKQAMLDPWTSNTTSWFDGYDWVVRLNPDVLIRNDTWLRETMLNQTIDCIAVDFSHPVKNFSALHSDFYAFRPAAIDRNAVFTELDRHPTAERHLGAALLAIRNRTAWIPNVKRKRRNARILGPGSPVIHWHGIVDFCPEYFNATNGKWW